MEHAKEPNPYEGASEGTWWSTAIIVSIFFVLVMGCVGVGVRQRDAKTAKAKTYKEQYLPGQPLDAVKLSNPSFAQGDCCYKVADRTSGACWWLVRMDDGWHVLPVCEGRSYVDQQLKSEVSE